MDVQAVCSARRTLLLDLKDVIAERQLIFLPDWIEMFKPGESTGDTAPNKEKEEYLDELREEVRELNPELLPREVEAQVKARLTLRTNQLVTIERELRETILLFDKGRPLLAYGYFAKCADTAQALIDEAKSLGLPVVREEEERREKMNLHRKRLEEAYVAWEMLRGSLREGVKNTQEACAPPHKPNDKQLRDRAESEEAYEAFMSGDFWTVQDFLEEDALRVEALPKKEQEAFRKSLQKLRVITYEFQVLMMLLATEEELPPSDEAQL